MGSNKICSDACAVVATTLVLKNSGVPKSINSILPIKKTTINLSGITFADVTKARKNKTINFKSRIPKSTVSNAHVKVPILGDFPPLTGILKKKYVPEGIVRDENLPSKSGAVLVSGQAPVPIVSREVEPPRR